MRVSETDLETALTRIRATRSYKDAEKDLDFWAVCLVGTIHPVPRYLGTESMRRFSSNEMGWHLAMCVTRTPDTYASEIDRYQVQVPIKRYEHVWVSSRRHANRLHQRMDEALAGRNAENRVRFRWCWVDGEREPSRVWENLLSNAIADIELGGEEIEVVGDKAKEHRIVQHARRHLRRVGG